MINYKKCITLLLLLIILINISNAATFGSKDNNNKDDDDETCNEPVVDTTTGEVGCSAKSAFDPTREDVRSKLPFPPKDLMPGKPFPRVHVKDLYKEKNEDYLYRRKPFILTNAADDWKAVKDKFLDSGRRLAKWFPRSVVDYYPMNMLATGSHPYLFRLKQGLQELETAPGEGRFGRSEIDDARGNPGKYLHFQLTSKAWKKLRESGAFGDKMHKWFRTDGWMSKCLKTRQLVDEYHIKTHWKIILIGGAGAGMFNHSDSLLTSSWHTHLEGLKWWYVCGNSDDYGFNCYEDLFYPGDTLFYPKHYHHQTQNIDTLSMTVTGTVANGFNYEAIATQLHRECAYSHLSFDLSGPLCDALDDCYVLWHQHFQKDSGKTKKNLKREARKRWKPWRKLASRAEKKKKDMPSALGNNYDGRNYINS